MQRRNGSNIHLHSELVNVMREFGGVLLNAISTRLNEFVLLVPSAKQAYTQACGRRANHLVGG
jgi:hypothetical protein